MIQPCLQSNETRAVEPAHDAAQPEQGAGPNAEGDNGDIKMTEILDNVKSLEFRFP